MSIERALGSVSISDIWGQSTTKKMRRRAREDARVAREDDVAAGTAPGARANRYRPKRLPADIMPLIGEAHGELASGNEARAIELLTEVVRRAPEHPEAYSALGELYEEKGDEENLEKARQLALVAAHLAPQDVALWRKVAVQALDVVHASELLPRPPRSFGEHEATAHDALTRVIKLDPDDCAAAADRASLRVGCGYPSAACDELEAFFRGRERDAPKTTEEAALCLVLARAARASRRDVGSSSKRAAGAPSNSAATDARRASPPLHPLAPSAASSSPDGRIPRRVPAQASNSNVASARATAASL
mmetsp:Transcript_10874/g.33564  ORF Transcript_10874/g.33564 Transcript_10874/m.33564 type:complete len:306 (+) Transcript_10874:520-1437(+)